MYIILIGAQGSGKGTQAELLAQTFDLQQVASGDLFRKAFEEHTDIGLAARRYVDRGELVPDELVVAMVLQRIGELDGTSGVLLDGFPRTVAQAEVLTRALHDAGRRIDLAVYLDVPRAELLERLSGRYICRASQHVYHATFRPPKVAGVCDLDGSELYQRSDDTGEAIQKRLAFFFEETIQVVDYYTRQRKLGLVDGNQSIERVQRELVAVINRFRAKGTV
jgi:adenylate kinase